MCQVKDIKRLICIKNEFMVNFLEINGRLMVMVIILKLVKIVYDGKKCWNFHLNHMKLNKSNITKEIAKFKSD